MGFNSVLEVRGLGFFSLLPYGYTKRFCALASSCVKDGYLHIKMLSELGLESKYLDKLVMFQQDC